MCCSAKHFCIKRNKINSDLQRMKHICTHLSCCSNILVGSVQLNKTRMEITLGVMILLRLRTFTSETRQLSGKVSKSSATPSCVQKCRNSTSHDLVFPRTNCSESLEQSLEDPFQMLGGRFFALFRSRVSIYINTERLDPGAEV